jgi:hypothetical protein
VLALPVQLAHALGAQDDLDERALPRAVLLVREREFERREPRDPLVLARERLVQRAARVSTRALAGPRQDFGLGSPAQGKLKGGDETVIM